MNNNNNYIPLTDTQMAAGHEDSIFRITQTNHTLLLIVVLFIAWILEKKLKKIRNAFRIRHAHETNKRKKTE